MPAMNAFLDALQPLFDVFSGFFRENKSLLMVLLTSAIGSGFGAWFGARAIMALARGSKQDDIQATANTAIAAMVALLGKLINFKKDLAFKAQAEAQDLSETLSGGKDGIGTLSIRLELWPEIPFALLLPTEKLIEYANHELDVIQLLKMLDYNLVELTHMVRQRNELIRQMNQHQAAKGALPLDGLKLYIRYAADIARNTDENLFFLDRAIEKTRDAARALLPRKLHSGIADVGLRPETEPLMPPRDFIKGVVK